MESTAFSNLLTASAITANGTMTRSSMPALGARWAIRGLSLPTSSCNVDPCSTAGGQTSRTLSRSGPAAHERTKAALAAAKRRGVQLGGFRGARFTAKHVKLAVAARQEKARVRASDLAPIVQELQAAGYESLRAIAAALDNRGIPAARGGNWSAVQVARLLEAAGIPFGAAVAGV